MMSRHSQKPKAIYRYTQGKSSVRKVSRKQVVSENRMADLFSFGIGDFYRFNTFLISCGQF